MFKGSLKSPRLLKKSNLATLQRGCLFLTEKFHNDEVEGGGFDVLPYSLKLQFYFYPFPSRSYIIAELIKL